MSFTNKQKVEIAIIATIVFFFLGLFMMCKKENIEPTPIVESTEIIQHSGEIPADVDTTRWSAADSKVVDFSNARMIVAPTRTGMYISDLHSHLSDPVWLDAKIKYYKAQGFNRMMIYNIDGTTYLTGSNATKLRTFTSDLHANGILMDIVISKASTCTTTVNTYINGCSGTNRPDGVRWEKEYYQQSGGFLGFRAELPVVYNWAKSKSPALDVSYYMPWTSNDCSQRTQFTDLCKYTDYIQFHDYRVSPSWSYVRTRMDSAAAAWKALVLSGAKPAGSKLRAGIIASAEDPKYGAPSTSVFSGIWFETHSLIQYWNAVLSQHNANVLTNEAYIDVRYIDIFSDKYYKQIKP